MPQKTGITILSFVPLQRKTAVSLTNQGCKGCQNEALCTGGKKLCALEAESSVYRGRKLCATKNRHNYPKNSAQAEFLSFVPLQRKTLFIWQIKVAKTAKAKLCATNSSSVPQNKALCHKPKQTIQEFGTRRITQKVQLFAAFVSLQGKTLFIWQIKVAKTAKAVMSTEPKW